MKKTRRICFNDEMNKDIEDIRKHFQTVFKVRPSNGDLMNLLIKTFKETKTRIKKKPKSKKTFMVEF